MIFDQVIGHDRPKKLLKAMLDSGRMPHAILLTGPQGVGKGTLALEIAGAANCLAEPPARPCGVCKACDKTRRMVHPDVSLLEPEGKRRVIKIDTIRELRKEIGYHPFEGRTKVYIIREADRMQVQGDYAANALLKTLEEPPPNSLLILTAPQESSLLPTVVSRCLRLALAPLPRETIESWLMEKRGLTENQARVIASISEGCLGRVIDLDIESFWARRIEMTERLRAFDSGLSLQTLEWVDALAGASEEWPFILTNLRFWYRDLMVLAGGGDPRHLVNEDLTGILEPIARGRNPARFATALEEIDRAEDALSRLIRPELVFENLLLALMEPTHH